MAAISSDRISQSVSVNQTHDDNMAAINTKAQTMPIIEHHGKPEVRQWHSIKTKQTRCVSS